MNRSNLAGPVAGSLRAHAILYLARYTVVADYQPLVAQSAGFALDDAAPKRVTGFPDQPLARADRRRCLAGPIMLGQGSQRGFKCAAQSAERGGLFLRYLVIKRVVGVLVLIRSRQAHVHGRSQVVKVMPAGASISRRGVGRKP